MAKSMYVTEEISKLVVLDDDAETEILELFSNKPPPRMFVEGEGDGKTGNEDGKDGGQKKKLKTADILDAKRITNFLIVLRKFTCSVNGIVSAVCSLDPRGDVLSYDNVSALWENPFKPEELEAAKNYTPESPEDLEQLSPAEVLPYHIARTPRWSEKIKSLMTIRTAREVNDEIRQSIDTVTQASNEILQSKRFKTMLASILAYGNFMNAGTAKGNARGIKLESLIRLNEVKASDKDQNLLHIVVAFVVRTNEDAAKFVEDFQHVEKAEKIAKEDVARELATFGKMVELTEQEVQAIMKEKKWSEEELRKKFGAQVIEEDRKEEEERERRRAAGEESDDEEEESGMKKKKKKEEEDKDDVDEKEVVGKRLWIVKKMMNESKKSVEQLTKAQEVMLEQFKTVTMALGEEPKNAKVEEFFATVNKFCKAVKQAVNDNEQRKKERERKERLQKRSAEDEEKRKLHAASKLKQDNEGGGSSDLAVAS